MVVVLPSMCHASSSTLLAKLRWLPVESHIIYKLATITFKTLITSEPGYLRSILREYRPARSLLSSSRHLLTVPHFKTEFDRRSFIYAAPNICSGLTLSFTSVHLLVPLNPISKVRNVKTHMSKIWKWIITNSKMSITDCGPSQWVKCRLKFVVQKMWTGG